MQRGTIDTHDGKIAYFNGTYYLHGSALFFNNKYVGV